MMSKVGPQYENAVASAEARDTPITYNALEVLLLSAEQRHNAFSLPSDVDTFAFVAVCGGSIGRHGCSSRGSNFSDSASGGVATFSSSGSSRGNSSANFTGLLGPAPAPTQGFSNGFLLLGVLNAKFVNGLFTRVFVSIVSTCYMYFRESLENRNVNIV